MNASDILAIGERDGDYVYVPDEIYTELRRENNGFVMQIYTSERRPGKSPLLGTDYYTHMEYYIQTLTVQPMCRKPVPMWLALQEGL